MSSLLGLSFACHFFSQQSGCRRSPKSGSFDAGTSAWYWSWNGVSRVTKFDKRFGGLQNDLWIEICPKCTKVYKCSFFCLITGWAINNIVIVIWIRVHLVCSATVGIGMWGRDMGKNESNKCHKCHRNMKKAVNSGTRVLWRSWWRIKWVLNILN